MEDIATFVKDLRNQIVQAGPQAVSTVMLQQFDPAKLAQEIRASGLKWSGHTENRMVTFTLK